MPVTPTSSTTGLPLASLKTWWGNPLRVSRTAGAVPMPWTFVHCSTSSVALIGLTVVSALPCQIETLGKGPVWLEARRTRSPHSAGVNVLSPEGGEEGQNQG